MKPFDQFDKDYSSIHNCLFDEIAEDLTPDEFGVLVQMLGLSTWKRTINEKWFEIDELRGMFRKLSWRVLRRILDTLLKHDLVNEGAEDGSNKKIYAINRDFNLEAYREKRDNLIAKNAITNREKRDNQSRKTRQPIAKNATTVEEPFIIEESFKSIIRVFKEGETTPLTDEEEKQHGYQSTHDQQNDTSTTTKNGVGSIIYA